ncbi:TPA: DotA/TraY family protein [Enterobacter asburiae]
MKKKNLFILSLFLSLFITSPAHALNLFGLVTGSEDAVGNNIDKWFNPFQSNITGAVLDVYLPIIMQLGGIIAAYTLIAGTMSTAHDGEMLGKKWSSMWVPIRTALVPGLLFPISNGYSALHMIILWLVLVGNQWGNDVWNKLAPRLITDNTYISVDNKAAIRQVVMNTLYSAACVNIYNENAKKVNANSKWGPAYRYMDTTPIKNDKVVGYNFGLPAAPNSSYGNGIDFCGSTKLKLIDKDLKSGSTLIDTTKISKAVQEAQIKANEALVKGATAYAGYLSSMPNDNAEQLNKIIDTLVNAYSQFIQASAESVMKESLTQSEIDKLTEKGWTYSYTFYSRIADSISEANAAVNRYPTASMNFQQNDNANYYGFSSGNQLYEVYPKLERLQKLLSDANKVDSSMLDSNKGDDGWYQKIISTLGGNLSWKNNYEASKASSLMPLSVSVNLGSRMIVSAETSYILLAGGAVAGGSIPFVGNGIQTAAIFVSPLFNSILKNTILGGNLLAFVIPMMPYIIGFFCVAGYYILIFEAMFGAPLLVLAMLLPDQDGIVGKQGQGYMLVLNIGLRPPLNMAGYAGSFVLTTILFDMLNSTFFTAGSNTEGGLLAINKGLTMLLLYGSLMLTVELMCLKLMHVIPDNLFKWIGGATSSVLGMVSGQAESSTAKTAAAAAAGAGMISNMMSPQFTKPKTEPKETTPGGNDPKATEGSNTVFDDVKTEPVVKGDSGQDIKDFDEDENNK